MAKEHERRAELRFAYGTAGEDRPGSSGAPSGNRGATPVLGEASPGVPAAGTP